jgi:hypothetical protein
MKPGAHHLAIFSSSLLVIACASPVAMRPVALVTSSNPVRAEVVRLVSDVEIEPDSGYSRSLPSGYKLAPAGAIGEGEVYRPTEGVLTVEGAHMHEAWLVIRQGRLVGFFLPVEKSFVSLSKTQPIQLEK